MNPLLRNNGFIITVITGNNDVITDVIIRKNTAVTGNNTCNNDVEMGNNDVRTRNNDLLDQQCCFSEPAQSTCFRFRSFITNSSVAAGTPGWLG